MQEAIFEKTIGNIAMQIAKRNKKLVMIAGPSSSGKTTFARRLSIQLMALGLHPHPITVDNYFRDRELAPIGPDGKKDFESIKCVDIDQFSEDMLKLLAGETVQLPVYNFITGKREYRGNFCKLGENDVLVIEGIHCLNDEMSKQLPADARFKIYISMLTTTTASRPRTGASSAASCATTAPAATTRRTPSPCGTAYAGEKIRTSSRTRKPRM